MKPKLLITLLMVFVTSIFSLEVQATPETSSIEGMIKVEGSDSTSLIDPENPDQIIDPGIGPSTLGDLRIDFVSGLNFNRVELDKESRKYQALAQNFFSETGPRGSYIQITDQRTRSTGWTVQVKQDHQFRNSVIQETAEQELDGAVLSLDKSWANSSSHYESPTVTRETISIDSIGTAYELATATTGAGRGVWTISFGASEDNTNNIGATLAPITDKNGNAVIDSNYEKPAYSNSAITLTVPKTTKVYPLEYETTLTWILGELP